MPPFVEGVDVVAVVQRLEAARLPVMSGPSSAIGGHEQQRVFMSDMNESRAVSRASIRSAEHFARQRTVIVDELGGRHLRQLEMQPEIFSVCRLSLNNHPVILVQESGAKL